MTNGADGKDHPVIVGDGSPRVNVGIVDARDVWGNLEPPPKCTCRRCAEVGGCRHDGMTTHDLCYSCAAEHRG